MPISAKRFTFLDQQTNLATTDFANVKDAGILNSPNLDFNNLDQASLNELQSFIRSNNLPDLSGLVALISWFNLDSVGNSFDLRTLLNIISSSPSLIALLASSTGITELKSLLPDLLRALNNQNVALPPNTSAAYLKKARLLAAVKAEQNSNAIVSTNAVQNNSVITKVARRDNTTTSITNAPLTGIQVNNAISEALPNKGVLADAVRSLPVAIKDQAISDLSTVSKPSTSTVKGIVTIVPNDASVGGFIDTVHALTAGTYSPVIVNPNVDAKVINTITTAASELGLPPPFSELTKSLPTETVTEAGRTILSKAIASGDILSILDLSLSPSASLINAISANGVGGITSTLSIPTTTNGVELLNIYTLLVTALSILDPTWNKNSSNTLSTANWAVNTKATTASAVGNVGGVANNNNNNNNASGGTNFSRVSNTTTNAPAPDVFSVRTGINNIITAQVKNKNKDSLLWAALAPNVSESMWRLWLTNAMSIKYIVPDFSVPGAVMPIAITLDQWMLCAMAFAGGDVTQGIKKSFPNLPIKGNGTVKQYIVTSPLVIQGVTLQ